MSETDARASLTHSLRALSEKPDDQAAWRQLFVLLWPFVIGVAWRRLRDRESAEDVAQEVFMRLVQAKPFDQIGDVQQLQSYVWRMAANVANDHNLRRRRHIRQQSALSDLGMPTETPEPARSEDRLFFAEALSLTQHALAPEETRLLNMMIGGKTLGETAKELGKSYSTTAVRLHRLRSKMHKLLFPQ